jgi:hypothetical protein
MSWRATPPPHSTSPRAHRMRTPHAHTARATRTLTRTLHSHAHSPNSTPLVQPTRPPPSVLSPAPRPRTAHLGSPGKIVRFAAAAAAAHRCAHTRPAAASITLRRFRRHRQSNRLYHHFHRLKPSSRSRHHPARARRNPGPQPAWPADLAGAAARPRRRITPPAHADASLVSGPPCAWRGGCRGGGGDDWGGAGWMELLASGRKRLRGCWGAGCWHGRLYIPVRT